MNEVTQPVRRRGKGLSALAMVAALTAFLAFAPLASATSDPIASGTTTIKLTNGFAKKLKKGKVKLLKTGPATVKGKVATLPVSEGEVDPTTGAAVIVHSGGLKFQRNYTVKKKNKKRKKVRKQAVISELEIASSTATLNAKVAGKRMKFAAVVGYTFAREGFNVTVNATRLKLTKKAVNQLNKKLGFPVKAKKKKGKKKVRPFFVANQVLGGAAASTTPKTVTVLSGAARLTTDEATTKKLVLPPPEGNLVEIEPIAPTQEEKEANPFTPTMVFPVSGGSVAPDASSGKIETTGGLKLVQTLGPEAQTTMTLAAIWVDLNAKTATVEVSLDSTISPEIDALGDLGRSSIATISLAGATITSDPEGRRVTVTGASSALQAVTAEVMNQVFGGPWDALEVPHPKFEEGDGLGSFSFTVQTQ